LYFGSAARSLVFRINRQKSLPRNRFRWQVLAGKSFGPLLALNPTHRKAAPAPLTRPATMRWIIAISLVLAAVGFLGIWIDMPGMARELTGPFTAWRRTVNGWEIASTVTERISDHISSSLALTSEPHPVIVSLLTALVSTLALVAFTPAKRTLLKGESKRRVVKRPKDSATGSTIRA